MTGQSKNKDMLDRLARAAQTGGISRRDFLNYSMAAGVTASAATGLWTTSAKAQPKQGGTFKVGIHDATRQTPMIREPI